VVLVDEGGAFFANFAASSLARAIPFAKISLHHLNDDYYDSGGGTAKQQQQLNE
jgi:hypothetical protein